MCARSKIHAFNFTEWWRTVMKVFIFWLVFQAATKEIRQSFPTDARTPPHPISSVNSKEHYIFEERTTCRLHLKSPKGIFKKILLDDRGYLPVSGHW
jgi:hypothetical protein